MGCLSVSIVDCTNCDIEAQFEVMNDISVTADVVNDITVTASVANTMPTITAGVANSTFTITAALVCGVGLDIYEYLYVNEGPLMVEDGYLKVLKSE